MTHICQWTGSSLVQVIACRLFGAKPLIEPMLVYCQLDSWGQVSVKYESEFFFSFSLENAFENGVCQNGGHFVQGWGCGWAKYFVLPFPIDVVVTPNSIYFWYSKHCKIHALASNGKSSKSPTENHRWYKPGSCWHIAALATKPILSTSLQPLREQEDICNVDIDSINLIGTTFKVSKDCLSQNKFHVTWAPH